MFKFSLQTALDIRQRVEKVKQKELAEKLAVEQQVKDTIATIHQNVHTADDGLNQSKLGKNFTIDQMKMLSAFKSRMSLKLEEQQKELDTARKEVAEKQKNLIEASRDRKTLEILKEKEFKRKMEKLTALERKNMDEVALNIFMRKEQ